MHAVRRICRETPHRGVSEIEGRRVGIKRNDVKRNVLYTVNSASRVEHSCFAVNINNTGWKDGRTNTVSARGRTKVLEDASDEES